MGLTLTNCIISHNESLNGGGLFNKGTMTLNGCMVGNNTALSYAGGILPRQSIRYGSSCFLRETTPSSCQIFGLNCG